jgi:uncharacterized pyridoxamine 5'-phosphate oxidase family protein
MALAREGRPGYNRFADEDSPNADSHKSNPGGHGMNRDEAIAFIKGNPAFHLATCEGDQPRVRVIMTYRADERGIVFLTGTQKNVNRQLLTNPRSELCYYDAQNGIQLRIAGRLSQLEDDTLKREILSQYTFLQPVAERQGLGAFTVWCLSTGSAVVWDRKNPTTTEKPFVF